MAEIQLVEQSRVALAIVPIVDLVQHGFARCPLGPQIHRNLACTASHLALSQNGYCRQRVVYYDMGGGAKRGAVSAKKERKGAATRCIYSNTMKSSHRCLFFFFFYFYFKKKTSYRTFSR